ncbi:hypothetical protein GCM10027052_23120 [Parafrigoribacterium mesophilum]
MIASHYGLLRGGAHRRSRFTEILARWRLEPGTEGLDDRISVKRGGNGAGWALRRGAGTVTCD